MSYKVNKELLGLSTIYQKGKIQIPSRIRKRFNLADDDKLLWYLIDGKLVVERG